MVSLPAVMIPVLVTGGAGYIGSHACLALVAAGYRPVVLDSLANARRSVVARVAALAGRDVKLVEADLRDAGRLDEVFAAERPAAVLHFAGLKAVGESVAEPARYYDVNVRGSLELLAAMERAGVGTLVFSSSATVYGEPEALPLGESARLGPTNPYGRSKAMVEQILADVQAARPAFWRVARLRYFNPVGAHASGRIGEDPGGAPNNLVPIVCRVAAGLLPELVIHGDDWPTPDGTGVRDYVHVCDLAEGHVAALRLLERRGGLATLNLGTGRGHSVLELVRRFEAVTGARVAWRVGPRRAGDIAACWADPSAMQAASGWRARRGLDEMLRDAWRWQTWARDNPGQVT